MTPLPTTGPDAARLEREAWSMGTRVHLVVEDERRAGAAGTAEAALLEVEAAEALLSTWDPTTPLSRLNRARPGAWIPVGQELAALLEEVTAWSERTDGAFDPRVGGLIDAWGLRDARRVPHGGELAQALLLTGSEGVSIRDGRLRRREGAWIDAGGFGKGVALRAVHRRIVPPPAGSPRRVLVDLGGQVLALAPRERPWTVEVAHPSDRSRQVAALAIHGASAATSGTSERGRHILDPRTGLPVDAWGSVTVVHADALAADVLATALYVMGPVEGLAWARREGVAALFVDVTGGSASAAWTTELEPWLLDVRVARSDHHRTRGKTVEP